jgi:dTDP-4-dehydrorhamnose 3,5-epimerase
MINNVIIKKLPVFSDERGWLAEVFRGDEIDYKPEMVYVSFTKYNVSRGPHEHSFQTDYFVFAGPGNFELFLWDNRKESSSYGVFQKIVVGETNQVAVLVPPGVVHGYRSISKEGSYSTNLPNKLYAGKGKKEVVDEIRHEKDINTKFKME